ncbi:ABC transporter ATP-binding protein [Mangrovicoccus sp. HB161399]|uniref:ABC transporter ATP-binding protein n=1 Tax=Mangrovicoccus sp. HB161399 TaxID=2720392 RepID=UPI001557CCB2|nr:ABC transporter ATP-binding protein [Mangrovicoccus sp. HB161399]
MPLLDVTGLTIAFGALPVVEGLDLSIAKGETLALVGESGSGKSVSALSLMGLLPRGARRTGGRILLGGTDITDCGDAGMRSLRGPRMGMIFQEPMTSLTPVLTIGRQMTEALAVHKGMSGAAARARAVEMLDAAGIPQPAARMAQYPHEFSGGMRQRVMIAMTLALEPELLIADEPTTALDVTVQAQILELMRRLARETGTSLLLITHDMGVVAEMADRVAVMRRGHLVETGTARDIFSAPAQGYTRDLLAAVPRMDGPLRRDPPPAADRPALAFRGIGRSFGARGFLSRSAGHRALDGIDLAVAPGETLALVGESGSGKSTLGRIGARLDLSHEGSVQVAGEDITALRGAALRKARSRVQMVFQDPFASLDPRFAAGDTLAEPLAIHRGLSGRALRAEAGRLMERVGLSASMLDRLPHEFSGGQRQRIAIARALAPEPQVVIADEPTSALDVSVQASILDLLLGLQRDTGLAFLFITHDLAVVRRIAHRVAVLRGGRLMELGPAAEVMDRPRHPYTQALIAAAPVPDPRAARQAPVPPGPAALAGPLREVGSGHWVAG